MTDRGRDRARALAAWLALSAGLVGLPALLVVAAGWPLPHAVPTPHSMSGALGGPLPDGFIVKVLAVVAWLAWAQLAVAVISEVAAMRRRRPALRVAPAGIHQLAARLVATACLLAGPTAAVAGATPRLAVASLVTRAVADQRPERSVVPHPVSIPGRHRLASSPSMPPDVATAVPATLPADVTWVTVVPGDNLWVLAERHLGSGLRSTNIWNLNKGRAMAGGERFGLARLIKPGWVLALPADAVGVEPPALRPASPATSHAAASPATAPPAPAPAPPTPPATSPGRPVQLVAPAVPSSPAPSAPETVGRPSPAGRPHEAGHGHPGGQPFISLGAVVGVSSLVAAGVIWQLERRRREQGLARRPGRSIPPPPPDLEPVERRTRAIADGEALAWVDLGLRYLARALVEDQPTGAPAVVVVRAGGHGLEVMVDPLSPCAPGRFEAADGGRIWRLDPDVDLAQLRALAGDRWPLVPALVTVGDSADGVVLANLEHAGSLAVDGEPEQVRALVAQMVLELESQPWAEQTLAGIHLVGLAGQLSELGGVKVADDPATLAEDLCRWAGQYGAELAGQPSPLAARAVGGSWEPHVAVVMPDTLEPDALAGLIGPAVPDVSGVAVVVSGPCPSARWRLSLDGSGRALLAGLAGEEAFELAVRVDPRTETVDALAARLVVAADTADAAPVVELRGERTEPVVAERGEVEIAILGPPDVVGAARIEAVPPGRRSAVLAFLAYLAAHRQPVPGDIVAGALWPVQLDKDNLGQPSPGTVMNAASWARKMLGVDSDGNDHVPRSGQGYRLGPHVTYDWTRFQTLIAAAPGLAAADSIDCHRRALQLVRGKPFEDKMAAKYFEWVRSELLDSAVERAVTDTAYNMADLALSAGDHDSALWAVQQGLLVDPTREPLFQQWMHAYGHRGDRQRVNDVYQNLCEMLRRTFDELQDPSEESNAIWRTYCGNDAATS